MEHAKRLAVIAAIAALAIAIPTRTATSETPPPVIEVIVSLTDLPPAIVTIEGATITLPEQPAPVVNVTVPTQEPSTVIVQPAPIPPAQVIYEDRTVEVERIIEVPSCLDYSNLPYFDLANAVARAFPGAQWSLSGSHYPGLNWLDSSPKPDMTAIIGGWLAWLAEGC